jgi:hypothetical protein
MVLVSNQFMHIQAHDVVNKPAAYAHHDSSWSKVMCYTPADS